MYEVFFKFYSCNEDIKPSAAFSCRHIKYKIHAQECTKTRNFYFILKIFWGGGTAPSPDPSPSGRGTPPPAPTPSTPAAPQSSALTHAPPTRKSGYGPENNRFRMSVYRTFSFSLVDAVFPVCSSVSRLLY